MPHLVEAFELADFNDRTELIWCGELGTDYGAIGRAWGRLVARHWQRAVRQSVAAIAAEAERRSH